MNDNYNKLLKLIKSDAIIDVFDTDTIARNFYNEQYLSFESLELLNIQEESSRRLFMIVNTLCNEMSNIYFDYFRSYDEELFMEGIKKMTTIMNVFLFKYDRLMKMNKNNKDIINRVFYLITQTTKLIVSIII